MKGGFRARKKIEGGGFGQLKGGGFWAELKIEGNGDFGQRRKPKGGMGLGFGRR